MELAITTLGLISFFLTKHLIVDFFGQPAFMYKNKGTFGHPGGIIHSLFHALASLAIMYVFFPNRLMLISIVALAEFVVHYFVDYYKVNICKKHNLTPVNSELYWWLLGVDQYIHCMTYVFMIAACLRKY